MLFYRLRPTEERLLRAARPLLTEPKDPAFAPAVRQLGVVYRHLRLDAGLPRLATEEELRGFGGPVAAFASEEDAFFPAGAVLPARGRSSRTSPWPSASKVAVNPLQGGARARERGHPRLPRGPRRGPRRSLGRLYGAGAGVPPPDAPGPGTRHVTGTTTLAGWIATQRWE